MLFIVEQVNPVDNMRLTCEHDQLCFDKIVNIWSFDTFPGVGGGKLRIKTI